MLVKIVISWSKLLVKVVFCCAVHKVVVYCCNRSSNGSGSADGQSVSILIYLWHPWVHSLWHQVDVVYCLLHLLILSAVCVHPVLLYLSLPGDHMGVLSHFLDGWGFSATNGCPVPLWQVAIACVL